MTAGRQAASGRDRPAAPTTIQEADPASQRATQLMAAEANAVDLFAEVERRGLIAPGRRDRAVSDDISEPAHELFGVDRLWHKRIVRSGPHTLQPNRQNPPDHIMEVDDIVFCDFGPIVDGCGADLGRTFVLCDDPVKLCLRDELPVVFEAAAGNSTRTRTLPESSCSPSSSD